LAFELLHVQNQQQIIMHSTAFVHLAIALIKSRINGNGIIIYHRRENQKAELHLPLSDQCQYQEFIILLGPGESV